jgi:pSer/pThr/pTyr-binding forkhead associated (FHA) protein
MILCVVMKKGEHAFSFEIEGDAISVGRSSANDIQIDDRHVSRNHLMIWKQGNRYLLKDLGSGNGTFVNGHQVPYGSTVEVKEGYAIVIGMSVLCLGEGSTGDMFAFLDSIGSCQQGGRDTTTVIVDDSDMAAY